MNTVVKCADFKPEEYFSDPPLLRNRKGNPGGKKRHYIGITTAFDIETSLIPGTEQSVMYIWQWQFSTDYTVIGRTWDEFTGLCQRIKACLPEGRWLVVYVHNLAFEFQFLKGIYTFVPDDIFAVASRKPVKADMYGVFELRCSYKLTNMSLGEFTKKMRVEHQKLSGDDFGYGLTRYWFTQLTDEEMQYCVNDVLGLVEALNALMARDGDTLQTIPLTSTGYVRRNAKRAMKGNVHHSYVAGMLPDYELYCALREAFRGGNTHANRYFSGDIVYNVHSADRSSSYPAVMCNHEFPMSVFVPILPADLNLGYIGRCITIRHKALLLRIGIYNLKLRDPYWGCPYLSSDKCRNIQRQTETDDDNGRILTADYLETTVTDVDLHIITDEYDGDIVILQGWYASYKPLPEPLRDEVIKYYRDKTSLKGVKGQEIYYDKAKALLNSLYGMMAQASVKPRQIFQQIGDFADSYTEIMDDDSLTDKQRKKAIEQLEKGLLEEYNKKAFLAYQWGVWVTAWARWELERGIRLVHETMGAHFIYCDTDSVKYCGDVDFTDYNNGCIRDCENSGAMAADPSGLTHYMGVYESEDNPETGYAYYQFKTLGAKKYVYVNRPGGECHVTIAGVNKRKGGAELDKLGGISAFEDGLLFRDAGGTQAVYNDDPPVKEMQIEGHSVQITANVSILPSTYRLGITGEYERILLYSHNYLDNPNIL